MTFLRQYSFKDIPKVSEKKVAVVTGANTGIGLVTARELTRKGWQVVLACRNEKKAMEAIKHIQEATGFSRNTEFMPLDLSSLQSVRDFSASFKEKYDSLHLLINNAGVFATEFALTKDGHEIHFGVNHLGHFLLTNQLLDRLKRSQPSRIVVVSSVAHEHTFRKGILFDDKERNAPWKNIVERLHAYGQSKLANLLFAKELARRLEKTNVYVNALHPGVIRSELFRTEKSFVKDLIMAFARNTENGAMTTLYVATSPDIEKKNIRGAYFKPSAILPAPFIKPTIATPSSKATDPNLAKQLWDLSERLVATQKFSIPRSISRSYQSSTAYFSSRHVNTCSFPTSRFLSSSSPVKSYWKSNPQKRLRLYCSVSESATEFVEQAIQSSTVVVFSASYCPYCARVKSVLNDLQIPFTTYELDKMSNGDDIKSVLLKKTGQRTVPNVFVSQEHVGGCSETLEALENGKLAKLLDKSQVSHS
eukprot:jgi/Galph1/5814/GphlegSOOS_G4489.1